MKVTQLLSRQVVFEETIWKINEFIWAREKDILTLTTEFFPVLEEAINRTPPRNWEEWGDVSVPAEAVEEDLIPLSALVALHEKAGIPDLHAYDRLLRIISGSTADSPWAEKAFGQRFLYEQVQRLSTADEDEKHEVLFSIYDGTTPGHPTAGQLSRAVFTRLAVDYPAEKYPEMILIARNVKALGFLQEERTAAA